MSTWGYLTSNKTTISSSEYMSDSLCHALLDYQEVIQSNQGQFSSLLSQKETLLISLNTKQNELFNLDTQLQTVLDSIDVKQTTGLDYSAELTQKASLQSQIATKKSEITSIDSQIDDVDFQIAALKNLLDIENNLTPEQIIELDDYVFEETWEDQNYTDVTELYNDAKKVFDDLKKPKEIISTNIINIFKLLEGKQDWKKVNIGDKFFINYERFEIDVETQLIELEIDHEGNGINVTIANTKDIERNEDKLAKLLYGSISTSNTVNMGKYKWDQINNVQSDVNDLINNTWDAAKREIVAGVSETVTIDSRGITITDSTDQNRYIRMTNSVIGLTEDGGNTFKTSLTPRGVVGETVYGKIIAGVNLQIQNESGNYTIDGNGFTIISTDAKKRVILDVNDGMKFQVKEGASYNNKFYYDSTNNRLVVKGEIDANEMKVNGVSVLTGDKSKISGNFIDQITTNQLVAGTAKITSAMIDNISANQIVGGTITGVTINVNTDLSVGNAIKLGGGVYNSSTMKSIQFNGSDTWIYTDGGGLKISSGGSFTIDANMMFTSGKNLNLSNLSSITWGSHAPNSKFG